MARKSDNSKRKHSREKMGTAKPGLRNEVPFMDAIDKLWAFLVGSFFVLLPFVVSTSGFESFDVPKNSFLWISTALLAVFGIVSGRLWIPDPLHQVDMLLLVSLAYTVVHTLLTGRLGDASLGIMSFVSIVLVYFIVRGLPFEGFHRGIWLVIAATVSYTHLRAHET